MQSFRPFDPEASKLARELVEQKRLSLRQLQLGCEWCARNGESLLTFLERFCSPGPGQSTLPGLHMDEASRRHFDRHQSNRMIWIEIEEKLVEVSTLNISRGGLAFRCSWGLPRGAEIRVGAERPVQAVIRYCVDNGDGTSTSGAEFEPRTVAEVQAIEELVAALGAQSLA